MKTIRKGNDIVVRWRIFRYGQKYDIALYRESISLVLSNMGEKKEITDYSIVDVNTIVFKYRAEDQGLGIYRLLLIDKSRNSTRIIEECNAFRLVNTSDAANNDDTLESAITITLTSELTAPADGLSAYEVALQNGFIGTEEEWLQSLKGEQGPQGIQGNKGDKGDQGEQGDKGLSAYQVAIANGFVGTEEEWLQSLVPDTTNIELAEAQRQAKELERIEAENTRQSAELERQNASAEAVSSANQAASNANEAAITAQQKAEEANAAASSANAVVDEFNSIIVQETGNSQDKVMSQKAVTDAMTASQAKLSELEGKTSDIKNAIQDLDGDTLYITDGNGNIIARFDKDGIESTEVISKGVKLSESKGIDGVLTDFYKGNLYVTDGNGNVIASVNSKGLHSTNMLENQWHGKVIATYGDSVTALNAGDYDPKSKESDNAKWARKVAKYFSFAKLNNRGIGSTTYMYPNNGGMIAWVDKVTGEYVNRDDNHSYKDYEDNPSFIPTGTDYVGSRAYDSTKHTLIRGCGCSWLRITSMFKESFKDSIDVVLVMYHNDFHQDMNTEAEWVEGSIVDKEWAQSEYYSAYNGDYNINCVKGGIASVIMKLQAWMPHALIVLMTPISGVHDTAHEDDKNIENPESAKMRTLAEAVKDTAFRMSIPCIDVYGTDTINSLNRNIRNYITDNIHPYSDEGCKVIARAIISQMISIIPNL